MIYDRRSLTKNQFTIVVVGTWLRSTVVEKLYSYDPRSMKKVLRSTVVEKLYDSRSTVVEKLHDLRSTIRGRWETSWSTVDDPRLFSYFFLLWKKVVFKRTQFVQQRVISRKATKKQFIILFWWKKFWGNFCKKMQQLKKMFLRCSFWGVCKNSTTKFGVRG